MRRNTNIRMCETIMQLLSKQFMAWRKSEEFLDLDIDTACMILSADDNSEMDIFISAVDIINNLEADKKEKYIEMMSWELSAFLC